MGERDTIHGMIDLEPNPWRRRVNSILGGVRQAVDDIRVPRAQRIEADLELASFLTQGFLPFLKGLMLEPNSSLDLLGLSPDQGKMLEMAVGDCWDRNPFTKLVFVSGSPVLERVDIQPTSDLNSLTLTDLLFSSMFEINSSYLIREKLPRYVDLAGSSEGNENVGDLHFVFFDLDRPVKQIVSKTEVRLYDDGQKLVTIDHINGVRIQYNFYRLGEMGTRIAETDGSRYLVYGANLRNL